MVKKNLNKILIFVLFIPVIGVFCQDLRQKNLSHNVWKSLIIPGWGEYSLNQKQRGKLFIVTETLLWIGVSGSIIGSRLEKNTYQSIAREHAGISKGDKPRQFWVDIGNYNNKNDFIAEHLRWRDFDAIEAYKDKKWDWDWDSSPQQKHFENKRVNSDQLLLAGKFLIGGIVLNHIISGIDVLYLSRKLQNTNLSLSVYPTVTQESEGVVYQISFIL